MQRKPGFPVANCSIKMPEGPAAAEPATEEDGDQVQRRQQLINFGHAQWGFNNWSWSVSKQDLDFVDFSNGKYCAGVVAFVSITVKSFDIHRENIGYATSLSPTKGAAIYKSRKCAVTNALRETLLSFGGSVATELMELLEVKTEVTPAPAPAPADTENNQNLPNKQEPKNSPLNRHLRKESSDSNGVRSPHPIKNVVPVPCASVASVPSVANVPSVTNVPGVANVPSVTNVPGVANVPGPPVAKAHPMPANIPATRPPLPPAPRPPAPPPPPHMRPNSNESNPRPPESAADEEARAERKRRQQRAQEEFRRKHRQGHDEDVQKPSASFDHILMDIPSQDIEIEQTGEDAGKRKSPAADGGARKRANVISKLDIVTD